VSTPANPQHLLRRPKKPQPKTFSWRIPIIAGIVVVITGGGIAGFTAFGHGKGTSAPVPAATTETVSLSSSQTYAPPVVAAEPAKHKTHKPSATPDASPSPNATQTPASTPTPATVATPAGTQTQTASSATAKHVSNAARLAAAHRAAQALASSGVSAQPRSSVTSPTQVNSNPAPVPVSTQPPTQAAATPDAEPTPVYAPTIVVDARFVDRVEPVYPDIAKEQGVGGTAIVLATIGPDGRVLSVSIDQSTGNRQLDSAAVAAAHSSRFEPPEIDGKPATETYRIVYTFDPNG
jgi:TonB family protein